VAEQGLPDYEASLWNGFFAPASIPAELAARIAADINGVLKLAETREKLAGAGVALWEDSHANFRKYFLAETREKLQGAGVSLFASSHAEFKRFFPAEVEKWRGVVKKANLKLE
jgi:tripartite-type tricarboxylate transporter receptor subunit TctC